MKKIMAVCAGNNDRSPTIELVGNLYLANIGADKDFMIVSSGTNVNKILTGDYPTETILKSLDVARDFGWEHESFERFRAQASTGFFNPEFDVQTRELLEEFCRRGREERDAVLKRLGYEGAKRYQEQTIARNDVVLVVAVDQANYDIVKEIYSPLGPQTPKIEKLADIVRGREGGRDHTMAKYRNGDARGAYERMIERLVRDTPKALKRIVGA